MARVVTNAGMVASETQMRTFIAYLQKLTKDLTDKLAVALSSVEKMQQAGYTDNTFNEFRKLFVEEAKFIAAMSVVLTKSGVRYEELAKLVHEHNEHIMQSVYGSDFKNLY